jgi:hypothetical protein
MMPQLTVFFAGERMADLSVGMPKIGRSMPIVAENRAKRGMPKFPFEIKSANFRRIGHTVFERARKKFALLDQCVTMDKNNRVE